MDIEDKELVEVMRLVDIEVRGLAGTEMKGWGIWLVSLNNTLLWV